MLLTKQLSVITSLLFKANWQLIPPTRSWLQGEYYILAIIHQPNNLLHSHSLGGAHALLAGMDLYQREKRLTASNLFIHTAGCPRVGNPTFANYVASTGITFTRSVNQRDSKWLLRAWYLWFCIPTLTLHSCPSRSSYLCWLSSSWCWSLGSYLEHCS